MENQKFRALVCCRAGIGSSMMLKVKVDQVIKDNGYPIETEYGNLEALGDFNGNLIITMSDLVDKMNTENKIYTVVGITSILDKEEIKEKLSIWIKEQDA